MKVFIVYNDERVTLDVMPQQTVADLRETVRDIFQIGPDEAPPDCERQETYRLTLTYAGADLNPAWYLVDVGIVTGVTLRAVQRQEVKASLLIHVIFTEEVMEVSQKIDFRTTRVAELRGLASRMSGLPVGCFRLLSPQGVEMFDIHVLEVYGMKMGDSVRLEVWDGWSDLLKAAFAGQVHIVTSLLSQDDVTARYQCKVVMYIAANSDHSDLALTMMKLGGIRADEPVGYHPTRQWCKSAVQHVDALKTPVHEAARAGQLGVLRTFVHLDIGNVLTVDGNGMTPLNVALRWRQKQCASFLLTKQWSQVPYSKKNALPLFIYVKMKQWCERARERVYMKFGQWKSSLRRKLVQEGLVGYGVQLDGFSKSALNSLPTSNEAMRRRRSLRPGMLNDLSDDSSVTPETYFRYITRSHKTDAVNRQVKVNQGHAGGSSVIGDEDEETTIVDTERSTDYTDGDDDWLHHDKRHQLPAIKSHVINGGAAWGAQRSRSHKMLGSDEDVGGGQRRHNNNNKMAALTNDVNNSTKNNHNSINGQGHAATNHTKSRARGADPVPTLAINHFRRPFVCSPDSDVMSATMDEFHRRHGLTSRDYANRCLAVARKFKDKSWMGQVLQAQVIAKKGVTKTISGLPHLFARSIDS